MKLSKKIIEKFKRDVQQYQEFIESKRILRYSRKKHKYALRIYRPSWWFVKRFKENYYRKYGKKYQSKRKRS